MKVRKLLKIENKRSSMVDTLSIIVSGSHWILLDNDDIIEKTTDEEINIRNVNKAHEGKYGCAVSNGFEPNLWNEFTIGIIGKI